MTTKLNLAHRESKQRQLAKANQLKSAKMNFVQIIAGEEYNWNISKALAKLGRPRRDFDTWMAEDDNFALAIKEQLDVIKDRFLEVSIKGAVGDLDEDAAKRIQWTQLRFLMTNLDKRFQNKTKLEVSGTVKHTHDISEMSATQLDSLIGELSGAEEVEFEVVED